MFKNFNKCICFSASGSTYCWISKLDCPDLLLCSYGSIWHVINERLKASSWVRLAEALRKGCPSTSPRQAFRWNIAIKTVPHIVTLQTFLQEGTGVVWLARVHLEVFFGNSLLIVYRTDRQVSSQSPTSFCIRQFFKNFFGQFWTET